MADQSGSVVPPVRVPTEAEFRGAMLSGLAHCGNTEDKLRKLAAAMDMGTKGLGNILNKNAMPGAKRLWDALTACPYALDDIADLYGFELVRKSADDGSADTLGTAPLAVLLAQVAVAESPTSHGGCTKTHQELLAMEGAIRAVHALTGEWLHEITMIRAPRAVRP